MKFLVMWSLTTEHISDPMLIEILRVPEYARRLEDKGKIEKRLHVLGQPGGAWIVCVESVKELERLLATSPILNYASYQVYPLTEMDLHNGMVSTAE